MTVKQFLEITAGIDEYGISGAGVCTFFGPIKKDTYIAKYGEREIEDIYFYIDTCDQRCCDISIK